MRDRSGRRRLRSPDRPCRPCHECICQVDIGRRFRDDQGFATQVPASLDAAIRDVDTFSKLQGAFVHPMRCHDVLGGNTDRFVDCNVRWIHATSRGFAQDFAEFSTNVLRTDNARFDGS